MEQRLIQSPQMIQAMQVLQLSSLDLQERIEQELMENPFLEVEDTRSEDAEEQRLPENAATSETTGLENMLDELERYERDYGDGRARAASSNEDGDRKLEAMANTPASYQSLAEALIGQLALLDLTERQREIAEYLIWSLDHRGYLAESLEEIAGLCEIPDVTVEEIEEVLLLLRDHYHPALGARDLRECLLLQIHSHHIEDDLVRTLISDHLEDITTNRLPRIAKLTECDIDDVKEAIEAIRHLDPVPGQEYGTSRAAVITPDVIVEETEEDGYDVRLTRQHIPELAISPSYRKLLQQATKGDGVQQWVKKRLESARWFIDAIHQRQNTMLRIAKAIFRHQEGFLANGVRALKPLRMQEVADEAGVHISTVSRAVSGKYAQTPQGIHPLKFFFTSGTAKNSGEVASQVSIKHRIREIVAQEDSQNPLSDDQIAAHLEKRDGIKIARRTVTKYRKALAIPSSSQRREF